MLIDLFKTFFIIGAFTFGGGTAMISIMEKTIVRDKKWLDIDEFLDLMSLAQASPGALAVNSSIIVGYKLKGLGGAIISCLGTVLPSFLIMLVLATVFLSFRSYTIVENIFNGVRPVVAALMASSVLTLALASKFKIGHYFIVGLVAFMVSYLNLNPILIILLGGGTYLAYKIISLERSKK